MSIGPLLRGLAAAIALRSLGAALSHAAMAVIMAIIWIDPLVLGLEVARDVEFILLMEFLVGFRFLKGFPRWLFIVVYVPFAVILGAASSSFLITILFFWHLASSVWGDFDMAHRHIGGFLVRYLPTFLWFVLLPFAVVVLRLPALGWEAHPGLAFSWDNGWSSAALLPAWATLYFVGRTVLEIAIRRGERTGALDRAISAVEAS